VGEADLDFFGLCVTWANAKVARAAAAKRVKTSKGASLECGFVRRSFWVPPRGAIVLEDTKPVGLDLFIFMLPYRANTEVLVPEVISERDTIIVRQKRSIDLGQVRVQSSQATNQSTHRFVLICTNEKTTSRASLKSSLCS
jgi:hypothetical protein